MENKQPATSNQQPLALALASAALLILAFPNFGQPWAAWVALVPWLLLLRRRLPAREAFGWSWLIGFVFFLGSMWWLVHLAEFGGAMALLGCGVLCAYLALFFGGFGWLVSAAARREGRPRSQRSAWGSRWWLWFVPAAWVGFEYARSHLLSGFGWNLLAYSQSPQLGVIQVSDLAGAWAVSFLIVLVNVALADMAHTLMWAKGRRTEDREALTRATLHTVHGLLAWLVIAAYGSWRLDALQTGPKARVAVVQGSIPQEQKWDAANRDAILRRYDGLAKDAAASRPDLIVWPETAVPGLLDLDDELRERVAGIARAVDVPMLVGAPMSRPKEHTWLLTNSAALITAEGRIAQRHDKLHLVPFGEFVPGERLFPWLRDFLPPIGEFVPGTRYTVFDIKGQGAGDGGRGKSSARAPRPAPRAPHSIMVAPWPKPDGPRYPEDAKLVGALTQIITQIRSIRSEFKLPPAAEVNASLALDHGRPDGIREAFEAQLKRLARVGRVAWERTIAPAQGMVPFVIEGGKGGVHLQGTIDVEQHRRRIQKELQEQLRPNLQRIETLLKDDAFRAKAPEEILGREEERRRQLLQRTELLEAYLKALG
jgi:apolipoprotein N-acyltransferase